MRVKSSMDKEMDLEPFILQFNAINMLENGRMGKNKAKERFNTRISQRMREISQKTKKMDLVK